MNARLEKWSQQQRQYRRMWVTTVSQTGTDSAPAPPAPATDLSPPPPPGARPSADLDTVSSRTRSRSQSDSPASHPHVSRTEVTPRSPHPITASETSLLASRLSGIELEGKEGNPTTPAKSRSSLRSLATSTTEEGVFTPNWFSNRIEVCNSDCAIRDLIEKVGGLTMSTRFDRFFCDWRKLAEASVKDIGELVQESYPLEASLKVDTGVYWIETLSATLLSPNEGAEFKWIPRRSHPLARTESVNHVGGRKPDGILIPENVDASTVGWANVASVIEFSMSTRPNTTQPKSETPVLLTTFPPKLGQLLVRLVDILAEQSTRFSVWGLDFFGPGQNGILELNSMDREMVRQARLADCWGANLGTTTALLATFATATLYELGYSPLVNYSSSLVPLSIDLDGLPPFTNDPDGVPPLSAPPTPLILRKPLCCGSSDITPFSRSTSVFDATSVDSGDLTHYVVKLSWVADVRAGREAAALSRLNKHDVQNVPTLVYALSSQRLSFQSRRLPNPSHQSRHLTIIIVSLLSPCIPLINARLSFPDLLRCVGVLIKTLQQCEKAGVRHRDPSTGNLLFSTGNKAPLLNDFDCCWIQGNATPPSSVHCRTGTLDTASIAVLQFGHTEGFIHLGVHDLESMVYCFWKILLWTTLRPSEFNEARFGEALVGCSTFHVVVARQGLWSRSDVGLGPKLVELLRKEDLIHEADVLEELCELKEKVIFETSGGVKRLVRDKLTGDREWVPVVPPDYDDAVIALCEVFC